MKHPVNVWLVFLIFLIVISIWVQRIIIDIVLFLI